MSAVLDDRPTRWVRTTRVLLVLAVVVAVAHAVAALLQPVWAGLYLGARYEMLAVHFQGGNVVFVLGWVQPVVAVLLWIVGRGWAWFALASLALAAAEYLQFSTGMAGELAVHVPLGVSIVAGSVATATVVLLRTRRAW